MRSTAATRQPSGERGLPGRPAPRHPLTGAVILAGLLLTLVGLVLDGLEVVDPVGLLTVAVGVGVAALAALLEPAP